MNILMAVATKHGSTHGIGEAIAEELRAQGATVDLSSVGEIGSLKRYDAVILGSAVYMGHWLAEARNFISNHQSELVTRPVWLFSSGPLGQNPSTRQDEPVELATLIADTGARGHRTFRGRLDPTQLGLTERLMVKLVKAPAGDYRDWDEIQRWAREIAAALQLVRAMISRAGVEQVERSS